MQNLKTNSRYTTLNILEPWMSYRMDTLIQPVNRKKAVSFKKAEFTTT